MYHYLLIICTFFVLYSSGVKAIDPITLISNLANTESNLESVVLEKDDLLNNNLDQNLENFNYLISIFNQFKEYDVSFANSLLNKIENQQTLSGDDLVLIRRMMKTFYKINKRILDFSHAYDLGGFSMANTFSNKDINIPMFKGHLIWLSGNLLVIDHLEQIHGILFEKDGNLRRIVKNTLLDKENNPEGSDRTIKELMKIDEYTLNIAESKKFSQQINLVRQVNSDLEVVLQADPEAVLLLNEILNNQTSKDIATGKRQFHINSFSIVDNIIEVVDSTLGWFSKIFGNAAGSIKFRKGHLLKNPNALLTSKEILKPMDIIFDRSPFALTDFFIPGYFDHVALYLGTRKQLEEIGMWNSRAILPYQQEIENGKVILEAVREGVHLNTLENFLNVDELLVIRKNDILSNKILLSESLQRGMNQIGKAYDFNFDISTLDKVVCSELIYIVFGNVNWPTEYRLGRPTVSPDNIAEIIFYNQTKFNLETFIISIKDQEMVVNNDLSLIADKLNYELRASNGTPLLKIDDPTNNFFKRTTKCYTEKVALNEFYSQEAKRVCNTSYAAYNYQEQAL